MAIINVQRAITPKVGNRKLWFMCSAHRLMMLYIYVNFRGIFQTVFNSHSGLARAHGKNGYIQCSKDNNSKSRQPIVMVHVFCTALHLCEVSRKYLKRFSTHRADTSYWQKWLYLMFKGL